MGENIRVTQKIAEEPASQAAISREEARAELEQMAAILNRLVAAQEAKRVRNAVDDARSELESKAPRKEVIGEAIERAIKFSGAVSGAAKVIAEVAPHLERFGHWLGPELGSLLIS